jgi:hypothetical protein
VIEVLGQLEPEPPRGAAGNVGVGGEVRVDLDREGKDAGPEQGEGRIAEREYLVGDYPDVVGNHQLLEKTPADQPESALRLLDRKAAP